MEKLKRGNKIYLDNNKEKESIINTFLECRDGIVEVFEYRDESGYGSKTRLFYCQDTKHEVTAIIRQIYIDSNKEWVEEAMFFDSDSFRFLEALINNEEHVSGGKYFEVRNYNTEQFT